MQDISQEMKIRRVKFSTQEDQKLAALVQQYGFKAWAYISTQMPGRSARQCRDRWNHYLSPNINISSWTPEEDQRLIDLLYQYGKQWSQIAHFFPGRAAVSIRNRCCKLSRQPNSDPIVKEVLTDEPALKTKLSVDDAKLLDEDDLQKQDIPNRLPSCLSLLKLGTGPDATKLKPLFKTLPDEIPLQLMLFSEPPSHLTLPLF